MQDIKTQSHDDGKEILVHWKKLIFGAFVGLFFGVIAYVLLPSKWESVAFVQVGSLMGGEVEGSLMGGEVEALPIVIERLKLSSFKVDVAQRAGRPEILKVIKGKKKIKARKIRKTDVIEIKIQSNTPELAKASLEAVVNQLIFIHAEKFEAYNSRMRRPERQLRMREDIKNLSTKIKDNKNIASNLAEHVKKLKNSNAYNSLEYAHLMSSQISLNDTLITSVNRRSDIEMNLLMDQPRPTRLIEPVNVSDHPVSPRLFFTLLAGMLIGLIFSAGFIYSRSRP